MRDWGLGIEEAVQWLKMDFLDQGYHLEHAAFSARECDASLEVLTGETARKNQRGR